MNNYTQIVHSIFGESVGTCYGSFSCSCNRQQGRLYVANKTIMFYSNLFGFERRLCMYYSDVIEVKIHRSTSIWVSMIDGEDFVFKSFSDRQRVITLIQKLMVTTAAKSSLSHEGKISNDDELEFFSESMVEELVQQEDSTKAVTCEPLISLGYQNSESNARETTEAESCPIEKIDVGQVPSDENGIKASSLYSKLRSLTGDLTEDLMDAWKKEKESKRENEEVIVKGFMLDCTLGDFFDLFLADDAPYSVPGFQESKIGDTELEVSKWTIDDSDHPSVMARAISFRHPISNKLGFGPSSTIARRKQTLHRHETFGICMYTTTNIKGVPASNTFYVSERWLIESIGSNNSQICLTILNEIVFTKRSLLKQVITSSTRDEVRGWYKHYLKMLSSQVQSTTITTTSEEQKSVQLRRNHTTMLQSITEIVDLNNVWILLSLSLFLAVLLQNYLLWKQVQIIERQTLTLQLEQKTILEHLKTIQHLVVNR
mmetsp:Transcript_34065/g.37642  ORF Transcript_34065/g.37642 Transcript_34065/m.37642 type:complete len:486 (-) Transcript_34065:40-1497(-)